ncbi:hypothetical protein HUJ05_007203 [Dendroctonus ponderosae]|nr:hypothetical protein HUJ05_007203 [Dendroctonus ponderosae]
MDLSSRGSVLLSRFFLLSVPTCCQSGVPKIAFSLFLIGLFAVCLQFCTYICNPPEVSTTVAQLNLFRRYLLLAIVCLANLAATVRLTCSKLLPQPAQSSFEKNFNRYLAVWSIPQLAKIALSSIQTFDTNLPIFIGAHSYNLLIMRSEAAAQLVMLQIWKLQLQMHAVNTQLRMWHRLDDVLELQRQYHELLNIFGKICNSFGLVIAAHAFVCMTLLVHSFTELIFPDTLEVALSVYVWHAHAVAVSASIDMVPASSGLLFSIYICNPYGYAVGGTSSVAQLSLFKRYLLLAAISISNIVATIRLTSSKLLPQPAESSFYQKTSRFLAVWSVLKLAKFVLFTLQAVAVELPIFIGIYSFNMLIMRSEAAMLLVYLEIWKLQLQIQAVNDQLQLWHRLDNVIELQRQHHTLLNTLKEISNSFGLFIAAHSFAGIIMLVHDVTELIFPEKLVVGVFVYAWHVHTVAVYSGHLAHFLFLASRLQRERLESNRPLKWPLFEVRDYQVSWCRKMPTCCQSGVPKMAFSLLLIGLFAVCLQFCIYICNPPEGSTTLAELNLFRRYFLLAVVCMANVVATVRLTCSKLLPQPTQSSFEKNFNRYLAVWSIPQLAKIALSSIQTFDTNLPIFIGAHSYSLLIMRSEAAAQLVMLQIWKLQLQIQAVNTQLRMWHRLDDVLELQRKYHELLNMFGKICNSFGLVIAAHAFVCITLLVQSSTQLIFPGPFEVTLSFHVWYAHAVAVSAVSS